MSATTPFESPQLFLQRALLDFGLLDAVPQSAALPCVWLLLRGPQLCYRTGPVDDVFPTFFVLACSPLPEPTRLHVHAGFLHGTLGLHGANSILEHPPLEDRRVVWPVPWAEHGCRLVCVEVL